MGRGGSVPFDTALGGAGERRDLRAVRHGAEPLVTGSRRRAVLLHLRGLVECRCGLPESAYDLLLRSAAEAERGGDDAAARILQARAVEMIRRIGAVGQLPAGLDPMPLSLI